MTLLHHVIEQRHGSRCPCCARVMTSPPRHAPWRSVRPLGTTRTRAHDVPVRDGGYLWVWACTQCNSDQGLLPFGDWRDRLVAAGDPRAALVEDLALAIARWMAERGHKRSWAPWLRQRLEKEGLLQCA